MYRLLVLRIVLLTFIYVVAGCGGSNVSTQRIGPYVTAFRVKDAPSVDGILNEASWLSAEAFHLKNSQKDSAVRFPTIVRMLWDDRYLYVGFECRDTDAASTIHGRDGAIDTEDYISVAIDADADSITFCTIAVAPSGAVLDAYHVGRADGVVGKKMKDWNCDGLRVSVSVYGDGSAPGNEDRFWTVEMAIPFDELYTAYNRAPKNGDFWRINVYRQDVTGEDEHSTLTTIQRPGRRAPQAFAWLKFGG